MWKYLRFGYIHWIWTAVTIAGLLAIMGVFLIVTFNDITRLFG